jgi:hypothetical protein
VPKGEWQTLRYDDGTGDELRLPKGSTTCKPRPTTVHLSNSSVVSGKTMFDILPKELKSVAVRSTVNYAPHPYVWMSKAHALPTALGLEDEGLELDLADLPPWEEADLKHLPMCWKNPVTGALHLQVHPCAIKGLSVAPLPASADREGALFPDGKEITDTKEARELLYKIQRPGIDPKVRGECKDTQDSH